MAFDGLNLNPYSSVKSSAGTRGMSNLPMLENKAKARLLANQYANEQAIEAAKLGYQAQLDAFKPKETSWGSVIGDVFGSASKAGLFDGFGGGLSNSSSIWKGKDLDPGMTYWDTDMPIPSSGGNAWYNPFSWGQN
jgi:hypothetical protein